MANIADSLDGLQIDDVRQPTVQLHATKINFFFDQIWNFTSSNSFGHKIILHQYYNDLKLRGWQQIFVN